MNTLLIEDVQFVRETNELAAEIYMDKKYYFLTYREIAEYRNLPASEVKALFLRAKEMIKNKDSAWMDGLSPRAKKALIETKYNSLKQLHDDIRSELIDLETMKGVGHKVAIEIRRWCVKQAAS